MYAPHLYTQRRARRRQITPERILVSIYRSPKVLAALILLLLALLVFVHSQPLPPADTPIQKLVSRHNDYNDAFRRFKGRKTCGLGGSLEMRQPFEPLCENYTSLLESMSYGGRAGFDAPFQPRGCDFHIYDALQICAIFNRYEALVIFGDSLMRHLTSTFAMLIRENFEHGGQRQWIKTSGSSDCTCEKQVQLFFCHKTDVMSMTDVYVNDPASLRCPFIERPSIFFRPTVKYPLDAGELDRFIDLTFQEERPSRPYALVFGQGLWNDLDPLATLKWIDQIQARLYELRPYMKDTFHPQIFISPSAAGENKQEGFLIKQGNPAISRFEKSMRKLAATRGLDFFGTYNMSVQASVPDGTHSGVPVNLLKALTVVNWLDMYDAGEWEREAERLSNETQKAAQSPEQVVNQVKEDGDQKAFVVQSPVKLERRPDEGVRATVDQPDTQQIAQNAHSKTDSSPQDSVPSGKEAMLAPPPEVDESEDVYEDAVSSGD